MKPAMLFTMVGGALLISTAWPASPAMRVVKAEQSGTSLLGNGGFEETQNGALTGWRAGPKGFEAAEGEGRSGSRALRCHNPAGQGWFGASQTLALDRTNLAPLVVRGWSKAEGVSGSSDSGYSLYVDLLYEDGTPLWGQTANFRCGTHDWEQREVLILPEKPVRTLTVHCLFRGHQGRVWFDDVVAEEIRAEGGAVLFQGVPVHVSQTSPSQPARPPETLETEDGLALVLRDNAVTSLKIAGRELATAVPSGFLARDVGKHSDIYPFEGGRCAELGLELDAEYKAKQDHVVIQGRLSNTQGGDRAITLVFALPLEAEGWRWGEDLRRSRVIGGRGEWVKQAQVRCGATGTLSLYPLAPVWSDQVGLAIALDMGRPAVYRLGYHAGTRQLFIAYDFGLVPETKRFPGSADFRFLIYRFDPAWGFRAAFQKLMEIFPDYFVVRSRDQGIWMPFTDVSTVSGWQDFGFRYHEGNNNVRFDDENQILSFRYTEPMTWWMPMPAEAPRTLAAAERIRDSLAEDRSNRHRRMAQALQTAGMYDEAGQPCLLFRNEPWCQGAVWSLNPNPWLESAPSQAGNAATVHWNETIQNQLYGPNAPGQLDGEYLDSLEGYVTAELNFRREHFRDTTVPLTFSSDNKRPALFKGLAVFEFTQWIGDKVHQIGKLSFANGVPYRFSFLCPWLDLMGTETDWLRGGKYQPASEAQMCLWRTMAGQKPYLLLMNTDYEAFTPDLVEKYFQRSLFWGMFPSMFSHNASENPYWKNPTWYNRDRSLFKKYIPLIKRVAEAGWQPITAAHCDNDQIGVERFGPTAQGTVYFTVFNDTGQRQEGTVRVATGSLGLQGPFTVKECLSNQAVPAAEQSWKIRLQAQEAQVFCLAGR